MATGDAGLVVRRDRQGGDFLEDRILLGPKAGDAIVIDSTSLTPTQHRRLSHSLSLSLVFSDDPPILSLAQLHALDL